MYLHINLPTYYLMLDGIEIKVYFSIFMRFSILLNIFKEFLAKI